MPKKGSKSKKTASSKSDLRSNSRKPKSNKTPKQPKSQPKPSAGKANFSPNQANSEPIEEHYETQLDEIQRTVDSEESIPFSIISQKLSIPLPLLENWAKILDKSDILELYYPVVGEPLLRKKGYTEEKTRQKSGQESESKPAAQAVPAKLAAASEAKGEEPKKEARKTDGNEQQPLSEAQKKLTRKKKNLISIILVAFIIIMLIAVIWLAIKGGYIKIG